MSRKVRYEINGRVAVVTIDRPEVRNAMDAEVFEGLLDAGRRAGADEDVRAVVVTGNGPAFSSGIDTTIFTQGGNSDPGTIDIAALQRSFSVFEEIPKPVIAAVGGPAFGAGLQLAIACDFRVAGADAEFSVMEVRWGLIPDLGGTVRLPRLIGLGRAKDLAMTARRVGAAEAAAIGLAERASLAGEHLSVAIDWAADLAAGPPLAIAAIKRLANQSFDVSVSTGLDREVQAQRSILFSADFAEAVMARVQKRAPDFHGR
ncbi:MAG: enoyl-CoA hydratase-related protein [Actinomycetota bacterium]